MIDLTYLRCSGATPSLMSWAALQEPIRGGVTQRVGFLGDRFAIEFTVPPMRIEAEGRRVIADLQQAQRLGGRVRYPQVDFRVGPVGTPLVDGAHTGGTTLALKGLPAACAIRWGQALNLVVAGRSNLYFAAANAVMDGTGEGEVLLTTPMRTHLAGDETVNLAAPVVEGWLDGNTRAWTLELARTVGLQFTITERS